MALFKYTDASKENGKYIKKVVDDIEDGKAIKINIAPGARLQLKEIKLHNSKKRQF